MFYALIVSHNIRFLLFPIYSLYYLLGLVPAKLWALVSMWDVGWGTSARSASELKKETQILLKLKEALPVIFWWCLIFSGVIFNIVAFTVHPPVNPDMIGAASFLKLE
jgi:hyaluronan synthase